MAQRRVAIIAASEGTASTVRAELEGCVNNTVKSSLLVAVVLLMASVPLFAHHGNAAYDGKTVTVKGTVTSWVWINPHTFLKFDAKDEKGNVEHWIGEYNAPSTLINFGFTAKTFKPGDEVTVTMTGMAKNGALVGRVTKVVLPDGRELSMGNER
jgi:hypothetical protein